MDEKERKRSDKNNAYTIIIAKEKAIEWISICRQKKERKREKTMYGEGRKKKKKERSRRAKMYREKKKKRHLYYLSCTSKPSSKEIFLLIINNHGGWTEYCVDNNIVY